MLQEAIVTAKLPTIERQFNENGRECGGFLTGDRQ